MGASICPECKAAWTEGATCQDHFHQMLYWENEVPANQEVHHLMVLSYYLQHPSLYSPTGLKNAKHLLTDFLERGLTTEQVRKRFRATMDPGKRSYKIKGTPGAQGSYSRPVEWTVRAGDVIAGGPEKYRESVRRWARAILQDLRASGNFSPDE